MADYRDIHDGDTVYTQNPDGSRLGHRFQGGDTPEVDKAQPGAQQSLAAATRALSMGYDLRDQRTRDIHGRAVTDVVSPDGGPTLTQEMVADGLAYPMHWGKSIPTPGEHTDTMNMRGAQALSGAQPSALQQDPEYQSFVEGSRITRLNALRDRIDNGVMRQDLLTPQAPQDPTKNKGIIARGLARGTDNMQATFYGFADALGGLIGSEKLSKLGQEGTLRNIGEAMRNPANIASYEDIDGLADAGIYFVEALSEFAPQLAADAAAALGTGGIAAVGKEAFAGIGKAALRNLGGSMAVDSARQVAAHGMVQAAGRFGLTEAAKAGAFASMYAQSAGETQMELRSQNIDAPGTALLVGGAKAALEYASLASVLGGVADKAAGEAVSKTIPHMLGSALKATAEGAASEGTTEAAQTLLDEYAKGLHKDGYQTDWKAVIDGGLKGAAAGSGIKGGGSLAVDALHSVSATQADNARRATAPEGLDDVRAQVDALGQSDKRYFSPDNRPEVEAVLAESGGKLATKELANGGVMVARSQDVLDAVPHDLDPADDAAMQEHLGYFQPKFEAMADPHGAVVIEAETDNGAVVDSQLVGASRAEEAMAAIQAKNPQATVVQRSAEEAQALRAQRVAAGRQALEAARQPMADRAITEPVKAPSAQPVELAAKEPAAPIDQHALVEEARALGIDTSRFVSRTPQVDAPAARRVLLRSLDEVLPDTGTKVKDELGSTRLEDLSDTQVAQYLDRLGVTERPVQYGGVKDAEGNSSPEVEQSFRQHAAGSIAHHLQAKFERTDRNQKGVNIAPLAEVLGVDAAELQRSFYAPGGKSRDAQTFAFKQRVNKLVEQKFGSFDGLAKALAEKSPAELHSLANQIGTPVKGYTVEAAADEQLDTGALAAEVEARKPTIPKASWTPGLPAGNVRTESAAPTAAQSKAQQAVALARNPAVQQRLFTFLKDNGKREGRWVPRDAGESVDSMEGPVVGGFARRMQRLVGKPGSEDRTAFVDAVREAMLEKKSRDERRTAMEIIGGEEDGNATLSPVEAQGGTDVMLDRKERGFLSNLARAETPRVWDNRTDEGLLAASDMTYFVQAMQHLVDAEEAGVGLTPTMGEESVTRVNRAFAMVAALKGLLPAGDPVAKHIGALAAAAGLHDADVAVGGTTDAKATDAVAKMFDQVQPGHARVATDRVMSVLSSDPALEMLVMEHADQHAELTDADLQSKAAAYLRERLANDPAGALFLLRDAVDRMGGGVPLNLSQMMDQVGSLNQMEAEAAAAESNADEQYVIDEDTLVDDLPQQAQAKGARDVPVVTENEDQASDRVFFGGLWRARMKGGAFPRGSKSAVVTEAVRGRNLQTFKYTLHGFPQQAQFDLVHLAMFAQGGEHAPASAQEALNNLWANLARAMTGPATTGAEHPIVLDPLTLPADNAVFYIEPESGKPVTIGEARGLQRAESRKQADASADLQRRDALSAETSVLAELLNAEKHKLAERAAETSNSDEKTALGHWIDALDNAGYRRPQMSAGVEAAFNRIAKRMLTTKAQQEAAQLVGADPVKLDDFGLMKVWSKWRTGLRELKTLSARLEEASARAEFDEYSAAESRVAAEMGDRFDRVGVQRQAEQELRGKDGVPNTDGDPQRYDRHPPATPNLVYEDAELSYRLAAEPPTKGIPLMAAKAIERKFAAEGLRVTAVATEADLPAAMYQGMQRAGVIGRVRGVYHRKSGMSYIIAANLRDVNQGVSIVLHETVGHGGVEALLGEKLAPVMRQIYRDMPAAERERLSRNYEAVTKRLSPAEGEQQIAEEFVAHLAETDPKHSLVRRVVAMIRQWIRTHFGDKVVLKWTHDDLVHLLAEARKAAAGAPAPVQEGTRLSLTDVGPSPADTSRAVATVAKATAAAKEYWKTGALPHVGKRLFNMVITRINGYSPQLGSMLFQQANADSGVAGRAWDQRYNASRSRMQGVAAKVIEQLEAGHKGKAAKAFAVKEAFRDAMTGNPVTEGGKQARATMDSLAQAAVNDGLRSVPLEKGFSVAVFDRAQVDKRRSEFEALLERRLGQNADVKGIVSRILEGVGVVEGAIAPGMPVGTHASTRAILAAIPYAELDAAGWLLQEPQAALYHWIDGVSKRAAWDSVFGDYTDDQDPQVVARRMFGQDDPKGERLRESGLMDEDGRIFDPSAKYKTRMDEIRAEHGAEAAAEVQDMIDGALGRHGQRMPSRVRRVYHTVVDWVGLTVLAFSGLASVPELAQPLIRAGGTVKLGDVFRDLGQARQFARDMGIVMGDVSEQISWQMMGEQYQSPFMRKITHQFFKWNGNQAIVNMARTLAVSVGLRYLQSAVESGDHGALRRLNIDAATVQAWVAAGRPTWNPQLPADQRAVAKAVADAVNQFVGEATLRPSRFQATNWGNNPWFKVIWQLKHFLYTYGDTMLGGLWREVHRRWGQRQGSNPAQIASVAAPLMLFAVFALPLGAASMETRDWIRKLNGQRQKAEHHDSEIGAVASYLTKVFSAAGGLGPMGVLAGMESALEYDRSPLLALSPALSKAEYLMSWGKDGELSSREAIERARSLIPLLAQNPALWPAD